VCVLRGILMAVLALVALGCRAADDDPVVAEADARWMLEYYVAALQESYRAAHGRFATHYSSLFEPGTRITSAALGRARTGLAIRIGDADDDGWSAAASVPTRPGAVCVLNVGDPPTYLAVPGSPTTTAQAGDVRCIGFDPHSRFRLR
jgi:hypothetical protein